MKVEIPRIVIAAPGSGSGKTWITCALLESMKRSGQKVVAYKCGPDYIDPMFHEKVIGVPSHNLDLFFLREEKLRELVAETIQDGEFAVIEGVMGLYDGLGGTSQEASTYHVAKSLNAPIILVVNAGGMGCSLVALLAGFLQYDTKHLIRGVILNRTSRAFYESIKPRIERELPVEVIGYFPTQDELHLESRHLGLKMPGEIAELKEQLVCAADVMEQTLNLEKLRDIAGENHGFSVALSDRKPVSGDAGAPILAVARDEAFCFYYADNLRLLEQAGLKLDFFSPLHDHCLPTGTCGILLGGGYPELKTKELAENSAMREAIRRAIESGVPSVAECGGFLYLQELLGDEHGSLAPMVGLISGKSVKCDRLVRFGYVEITEKTPHFLPQGQSIRGHEFHYYDSENNGADCTAVKPVGGKTWDCIHADENHWWGFPHLYYRSNPRFVQHFAGMVREYDKRTKK